MQIMKIGTPPNIKVYHGTCRCCGTMISFKRWEAEIINDQRDGDYLSIACPICNEKITTSL